jgi:hypothetical protein
MGTPIRLIGLLLLLTSTAASGAGRPFVLVTDVDDTIKITHVNKPISSAYNALLRTKAFAGMNVLYGALLEGFAPGTSPVQNLYALSGTPPFLRDRVERFLNKNRFPKYDLQLKPLFGPSTLKFKAGALEKLATRTGEPFLLVGDDTEQDPEAYAKFQKQHPERVMKIYIHRIRGREVPAGSATWYTAYDIATGEALAGRLRLAEAIAVGRAVLHAKKDNRIIPGFAACPKADESAPIPEPTLEKYRALVAARVQAICERRARMSAREIREEMLDDERSDDEEEFEESARQDASRQFIPSWL